MEACIHDHVRTPRGKGRPDGALHEVTSVQMVTQLLEALRDRHALDTALLDDVIIGTVQPVGEQGGVLARAAVLNAGYAQSVGGQQVHRFCASDTVGIARFVAESDRLAQKFGPRFAPSAWLRERAASGQAFY